MKSFDACTTHLHKMRYPLRCVTRMLAGKLAGQTTGNRWLAVSIGTFLIAASDSAAQCNATWMLGSVSGPSPREGAFMVFDSIRKRVVLFGGGNGATGARFNDTWEWDGHVWTQRFPTGAIPSGRMAGAAAFDSVRAKMIIFGGNAVNNSSNFGDTWEWDGQSWALVAASGPAARTVPGMTFDTARSVAILVGGQNVNDPPFRETWLWSGTSWTLASSLGPSGRYGASVAFDSLRESLVFFGGTSFFGQSQFFNDTWEWNGADWTYQMSSVIPEARRFHAIVFDRDRSACVMFGGEAAGTVLLADTWLWSGREWTQLDVTGPSARRLPAMVYDEARGQVVLFGGSDGATRSDTWLLTSTNIITGPVQSIVQCMQSDAAFAITATGPGPFTYQWRKGGTPIDTTANPSAATDTLLLNSVQASDAGLYDCIVSNSCGSVTSNAADLNVYCDCPPYTQLAGVIDSPGFSLPADPAVPSASLAAALNNENPRPFLDFDQIPGTTPGVTGDRSVAHSFTNIPSDLVSAALRFRIRSGPNVNAAGEGTDLMRLGFAQGTGNAANFSGSNPTRPYWTRYFGVGNATDAYFAGTVWGGGIDRSITLDLAALPRASQQGGGSTNLLTEMVTRGTLDLVVADDSGVDFAELTGVRTGGPTVAWVRGQPKSIPIACPHSAASFAVTAAGTGPFTFQWRKDQTPIDASANPTAATATLNLGNVGPGDAAEYDCLITNSCSTVISNHATLTVCAADFNCDGFITFEDFDSFVSAFEGGSPSADFNADGFLTFEDFDAFVAAFESGC